MREMLAMQPRFDVRRGKRALRLLEHKRFRAAYDFMMLRSSAGEVDEDVARFWTDVQKQNAEQRHQSFDLQRAPQSKKKRKRRRRRRKSRTEP